MNYFDDPNSKHFSFESFAVGLDENTFGVINFKGYEAISQIYDFEIMLVSSKKDIDLEDLLQAQAVFTIHRGENDNVLFNGILAEFDQLHEVNDVIFYRARLVPKLWWLSLTHHNQVFLDQSVPDIVEDALRDGGLETADFGIGALSGYEENAYVCQYDESHFNFVSRILERQGIYYYFIQEDGGEILTLTDTKFSHDSLKEGAELFYNPASGLEGKHLGEAIGSFTCRQKQLPAEIILKDYNYERPSLDITSRTVVDPVGRGTSYLYGEYFATPEEGERLAGIRAEELLCKKQEFFGESTVPYINPGFTFSLNNHYREDFNQQYLILEVTHEGNQSHLMSGGITTDSGKSHNQAIYHNSFKAIPNDTQFRPDRTTEKPKISGTIHAKIDSEVDGEYAQLDEQGRYHVRLPFDINDEHMDGKGSAPIRMMQSYAGKNRGMQFPLVKGTEVLLTFIEGNPDRPVIAGAVSNPETQGPVSAENQSESVIQTGGNNKIRFEDKEGSERIIMESPTSSSWFRIGAPNDPVDAGDGIDLDGDPTTKEIEQAADGIRIHTKKAIWLEAENHFGEYHGGDPFTPGTASPAIDPAAPDTAALLANFSGASAKYAPTGVLPRHGAASEDFPAVLKKSHIRASSLDTVNTQEGNIYDFGGYYNYNLGNSYAEDHLDQSAALNATHTYDLLNGGGPNFNGWRAINNSTPHKRIARVEEIDAHPESANWTNIWVDKKFGDSYEYTEGSTISVTKGGSQEVEIGGVHVEEAYRGNGTRKSWSIRGLSGGSPSEEKKWSSAGTLVYHSEKWVTDDYVREHERKFDRRTGALFAFTGSEGTGMGQSSFEFNYSNKASMAINTGSLVSTDTFLGAQISNSNYAGVKIENSNAAGAMIEVKFAPAVLKIENSKIESNIPGMRIKAAPTEMDNKVATLKQEVNVLKNIVFEMHTAGTKVDNQAVKASNTASVDSSM